MCWSGIYGGCGGGGGLPELGGGNREKVCDKKKVIWKKLGLEDFLYYKSRGNFFCFVEKKYPFIFTYFLPKNFIH